MLIPTLDSYGRALTGPGNDALSIRSVEWLRDHHFRWAVTDVENYWYRHHQPKKGATVSSALQAQIAGARAGAAGKGQPGGRAASAALLPAPEPLRPYVANPLLGEGKWRPLGRPVNGTPAMYVTYLRPDAVHTGVVAAVAWIDPKLVKAVQYAGALEPGGSGWAHQLPINPAVRPDLLAAFNSGLQDGGRQGRLLRLRPLRPSYAHRGRHPLDHRRRHPRRGPVGPGRLDGDPRPGHGPAEPGPDRRRRSPVPGVQNNDPARWGKTVDNPVLVWRSGLGVTANGAVVYVAGPGLSAYSLAGLLARAGAVRAMELDINTAWVDFFTYEPGPTGAPAGDLTVNRLLADMQPSTSDYLTASSRDCIALFAR